MNTPPTAGPSPETMQHLQAAYNAGELQFMRSLVYRSEVAPKGFIFYLINYETDGKNVYAGAYKMNLDVEAELLKADGKLQAYLCFKLAPEIT